MNKLEGLRSEIDKIDVELIALLEKRMDISQEIAEYKGNNGLSIFDKDREKQVIAKNLQIANGKYRKYIENFMHCIMDISKEIQKCREEKE